MTRLNRLALVIVFALNPVFGSANPEAPYLLSNKDYHSIFTRVRRVEAYLKLNEKLGMQVSVSAEYLKQKYAIDEKTLLPEVGVEGSFLKFKGIKKKIDLTNLHKGEIFDGNSYFRFSLNSGGVRDFERLVAYLRGDQESAAFNFSDIFFNKANAAESKLDDLKGSASVAVGLYAFAHGVTAGGIAILAGLVDGSALLVAGGVGGVILFLLIAETLVKYGFRTWGDREVVCENGHLFLKDKNTQAKLIPLEEPSTGTADKVKKYFSHLEISAAELKFRELFCNDLGLKNKFNKLLQQTFSETPSAGQTLPATAH